MHHHNYPLKQLSSFALSAKAKDIIFIDSVDELKGFAKNLPDNFYILGGGSNTVFIDDYQGTILSPNIKGITVDQDEHHYLIEAASGEDWHELVCYCLEHHIPGLENLALIPGNCGAAPIQNIGAYGLEFANVCDYVKWFDFKTGEIITLSAQECAFDYRDSVFKHDLKNKGVIVAIGLRLAKDWQPQLKYQGLIELGENPTPKQVFDKVVHIRNSKLPDPKVLPNAGSFFKNPIISKLEFETIQKTFPEIPFYPTGNGQVKLAAGWLIDQCGLKGKQIGGAAVHKLQALVLVNIDNAQGNDVTELAVFVQNTIKTKFHVTLEPEIRLVGSNGEKQLEHISSWQR